MENSTVSASRFRHHSNGLVLEPPYPAARAWRKHLSANGNAPLKQKICYRRGDDLPGLIGIWPNEIEGADRNQVIARLHCALRSERVRGRAGHWSYDLSRHRSLLLALKVECAMRDGRVANEGPAGVTIINKPGDVRWLRHRSEPSGRSGCAQDGRVGQRHGLESCRRGFHSGKAASASRTKQHVRGQ